MKRQVDHTQQPLTLFATITHHVSARQPLCALWAKEKRKKERKKDIK
jgi:hypothetical protein